jgi:hypothetical protein
MEKETSLTEGRDNIEELVSKLAIFFFYRPIIFRGFSKPADWPGIEGKGWEVRKVKVKFALEQATKA